MLFSPVVNSNESRKKQTKDFKIILLLKKSRLLIKSENGILIVLTKNIDARILIITKGQSSITLSNDLLSQ